MGNTVTICFANNKGGSGKSTSCSNVGAALAGMGKKVLLVDGDMQLNLSLSFFDEEEVLKMAAGEKNLYYASGISRISVILSCIRSMRIWIWCRLPL